MWDVDEKVMIFCLTFSSRIRSCKRERKKPNEFAITWVLNRVEMRWKRGNGKDDSDLMALWMFVGMYIQVHTRINTNQRPGLVSYRSSSESNEEEKRGGVLLFSNSGKGKVECRHRHVTIGNDRSFRILYKSHFGLDAHSLSAGWWPKVHWLEIPKAERQKGEGFFLWGGSSCGLIIVLACWPAILFVSCLLTCLLAVSLTWPNEANSDLGKLRPDFGNMILNFG